MCGIVGLFLKDPKLEPRLGAMLADMLITPLPPTACCLGGRVTWVNSQWKLRAQTGHFWVEINSEMSWRCKQRCNPEDQKMIRGIIFLRDDRLRCGIVG